MFQTFSKILIFFAFLLLPLSAKAATLFVSPSSGTYKPGDSFSVSIYTSSADQAMNAASGILSFPKDTLEVVSISKGGSIFSLWTQEPSFSNTAGTVNFEGIVLNPGFIGGSGKILTVNLKVKSSGTASLRLSSGSILANDGLGTNILSGLGSAQMTIVSSALEPDQTTSEPKTPPKVSPEPKPETPPRLPNDIDIVSFTHPDQKIWYNNNTPEFSWVLPKGTLEVRTLITTSTGGVPTIVYSPPISNKKVDKLDDGTYYFLVQIKTAGGWGNIARYQVNIDTTAPESFAISFPQGKTGFESQPFILFQATDKSSGLLTYEIKVGDGIVQNVVPAQVPISHRLPPQKTGSHEVSVTAIDNAGNKITSLSDFTVQAIEAPVLTFYPREIDYGELIRIRGTSYPNADVQLFIQKENLIVSQEETKANSLGDFSVFVTKRLHPGDYTITAKVVDSRGVESVDSNLITIAVKSQFLVEISNLINHFPLKTLSLALVMCLLFVMMIYTIYKGKDHVAQERKRTKKAFEKSLKSLHAQIEDHVNTLSKIQTKRRLTPEEIMFIDNFGKKLAELDGALSKEIEAEKNNDE
jgi:hypothetical protein